MFREGFKMKHFAIRSKSIRSGDRPFTTPGLGDRVHSALMAYQYSKETNEPVTIHVTDDKWSIAGGVISDKKPKSWNEIIDLFPKGTLHIMNHPVENLFEFKWLDYLKQKGYDAVTYHYPDAMKMHPNDFVIGLDATKLLKKLPCIKAEDMSDTITLPKKYVTVQFDTNDDGRSLNNLLKNGIYARYEAKGFRLIHLKGDMSLKEIGYYLSNATYHVGIDSGMLHMAQLYMNYNQIHLYNNGGYVSHHLVRATFLGARLNLNADQING